jgi:hypothetical protein
MDESAFRRARDRANPQPCAFEKAILARFCSCSLAERQNIAEREAVACGSPPAREQCAALRALLRQNSAFALKLTQVHAPLPHAKEMKVQCGGLRGLQQAAARAAAGPASVGALAPGARVVPLGVPEELPSVVPPGLPLIADVHSLVQASAEQFGGLANLPYSAIVQSVVAYQIRRRGPEQ